MVECEIGMHGEWKPRIIIMYKGKIISNDIESELLWALYWGLEYSCYKISEIFDCSNRTIGRIMKRNKIPIRSDYGTRHTDESKKLMSELKIGHISWNRGKKLPPLTDEHKEKISKANKGRIHKPDCNCAFCLSHNGKSPTLGRKHTKEELKKMSKNRIGKCVGENNPNWKGGRTLKIRGERIANHRLEEKWRKKVYERDNYTCQICHDDTGGNLNAHHIKSFADYPEERYDIDNGITLCKFCHKWVHRLKPLNQQ